jgi:hypothetical protein
MQLFDVGNLNILVGPKGLKVGDELTVRNPQIQIPFSSAYNITSSSTLPPNGTWPNPSTASAEHPLAAAASQAPKT